MTYKGRNSNFEQLNQIIKQREKLTIQERELQKQIMFEQKYLTGLLQKLKNNNENNASTSLNESTKIDCKKPSDCSQMVSN